MFRNVLVGVDGGLHGRDAIALASRLSHPEARMTLVHVHGGALSPIHARTPGLISVEQRASEEMLERERADSGVSAELVSLIGMDAGRSLHVMAERRQADLIVVGSCGRGAIGRAVLGDDTRAALNGAPCAVAIARSGYSERPSAIRAIGVAYNESPESLAALATARELAKLDGASVRVCEVVGTPTYGYTGLVPPAIGESIDVLLQAASQRMGTLPEDVRGVAVYGMTGEELAAFSEEVDLLVLGSRGYGPVRRLVLGSTCNYLERHACSSLLVLTRGREASTDSPGSADPQVRASEATTA